MRKDSWLFLGKLALISVALGLFWFYYLQMRYPELLKPIFVPLLTSVGVRNWRLYQLLDHFTNIVTYTALVLATPGLTAHWKKSLVALFSGMVLIIAGHFFLSWIDYYYYAQYQQSRSFFRSAFHFYLLNDSLPFFIWLIFYHKTLLKLFPFLKFENLKKQMNSEEK